MHCSVMKTLFQLALFLGRQVVSTPFGTRDSEVLDFVKTLYKSLQPDHRNWRQNPVLVILCSCGLVQYSLDFCCSQKYIERLRRCPTARHLNVLVISKSHVFYFFECISFRYGCSEYYCKRDPEHVSHMAWNIREVKLPEHHQILALTSSAWKTSENRMSENEIR